MNSKHAAATVADLRRLQVIKDMMTVLSRTTVDCVATT